MKKIILCLMILLSVIGYSQKKRCGTDEVNFTRLQNNPSLIQKRKQQESDFQKSILNSSKKRLSLTIPVVVHVIYNTELENISDDQILSQIDALNRDFNNMNSDSLKSDHAFYPFVGNTQIKFELAKKDPAGNITNGITRTKTSKSNWVEDDLNNDNMKFTSTGGVENWDPKRYLNIYTVRFAESVQLLGYAYFPEDLTTYPETDGVVIDFRCFGTNGTSGVEGFDAYKLGRTVTHEVGHWLGLFHIWGDKILETDKVCGDDKVSDTPPAEGDNSGNPTFPHRPNNKCGSGINGEMYMNYMDYVYDKSMVMFSKGQVDRMTSSINNYRSELLKYSPENIRVSSILINTPNKDSVFISSLKTIQLTASIFPVNATNKKINWICTPDTIAKIDQNGKITILKEGVITITVQTTDGSLVSSIKKINIVNEIFTKQILINTPNNDSVFAKSIKTIQLTAEVLPINTSNKIVSWSCLPDTVATIDQNGIVTILKEGQVTITAHATDGSLVTSNKKLNFVNEIKVQKILINTPNNDSIFKKSSKTIQLNVDILPTNCSNKIVSWICVPDSIATIDQNGMITILRDGNITIIAKATDGSLVTSTKSIFINIDSKTALNLLDNSQALNFYPNPVGDFIYINHNTYIQGKLRIFDFVGKLCFESPYLVDENKYNLCDLEQGNYIIELETSEGLIRSKLVKK
jgi:uncharacterized protein YjdB